MDENDIPIEALQVVTDYKKIGIVVGIAIVILTGITMAAYGFAKQQSGVTVLPGGQTYLGPGREKATPTTASTPAYISGKFTAPANAQWIEQKGKVFPWSFSYPSTLVLVVFPNDVTDSVAISYNNVPAQSNILFRVADINKTEPMMVKYIGKPKEYANNWWRQYSGGLKGVKSIAEFTNSKGMKGYRVKFINQANESPNENVFFEIQGRTDLMASFANGVLDQSVFDKMIDSFSWGTN